VNKRGTGMVFILISAILFSAKYISAAIFGSGLTSWDEELFQNMLAYIGTPLHTLSILALAIGISYICWAEFEEIRAKKRI